MGGATITAADGARRWTFADTPRLSTYVPVVNAGPFVELRSTRDGYDLGLFARRSLAPMLQRDAEELFDLTSKGLAFYGEQFAMAFPEPRYDQVFVPEFGGAMENYGCITWSDVFIFRDPPSYADREERALVLLHEMAHMWFGDMVTMRWWDDLWLNESFAEWACAWSAVRCTEFTDMWAQMLATEKQDAYAADAAPTTHPIRQELVDVATAAASFDAITYPKGAAVLKQLVAFVGEDSFLEGLRSYFAKYAWGNTTLDDLIAEIETASGRDLADWVEGWLETAGTDRLTLELQDGGLTWWRRRRTAGDPCRTACRSGRTPRAARGSPCSRCCPSRSPANGRRWTVALTRTCCWSTTTTSPSPPCARTRCPWRSC